MEVTACVLIVEDDPLIAADVAARVAAHGHEIMGPALTLADAATLIAERRPDAALLDGDVDGESSLDLALALTQAGVPLAFCTGFARLPGPVPEVLKSIAVLAKPVSDEALELALGALVPAPRV